TEAIRGYVDRFETDRCRGVHHDRTPTVLAPLRLDERGELTHVTDAPQPQSRRELRERERALAAARDVVTPRDDRGSAKRVARNTVRRDAVRSAAENRGTTARTIGSRLLSFGAMLFAAALAVGMTVP